MGGLGHSEVSLTWGIHSPNYIKSTRLHTIMVQMLFMTITSSDAYHKVTEWFLHHMNDLVLFRRYTQNLDTLEFSIFIAFLLIITIGEVCMLKFETSLLAVNKVIE
jgi:uncharacterized protein YggT (Ycf19 family)